MQKTVLKKYTLVAAAAAGIYLCCANYYIYYRIGHSALGPSDKQYTYMMKDRSAQGAPLTYAALGDSLTAGTGTDRYEDSYPCVVAQKMAQKNEVQLKDFSMPGARSEYLKDSLLPQAIAAGPDIVTVLIGTNDIHGRVGKAQFERNYRDIIEALRAQTSAKIYLISVPFIGSDELFLPPFDYYFHRETIEYNEVIARLASEYGVGYIDIATPTEQVFAKAGPHYAADSFHPSAIGYKLWAQIIYDHINQ